MLKAIRIEQTWSFRLGECSIYQLNGISAGAVKLYQPLIATPQWCFCFSTGGL